MHNKSIVVAISLTCSIGGWFLWNIILSAAYNPASPIYHVRDALFATFGRNALWWLTLILIVSSAVVLELGVGSLRAAFFTTDVDIFQELEKDPAIKMRFEEASAMELQAGWNYGVEVSPAEIERDTEEQKREGEVRNLLRNRPDTLEEGRSEPVRRSTDIHELLGRRFGNVRAE